MNEPTSADNADSHLPGRSPIELEPSASLQITDADDGNDSPQKAKPALRWLKIAFNTTLIAITFLAIAQKIYSARSELADHPISVRWDWAIGSILGFAGYFFFLSLPWLMVMRRLYPSSNRFDLWSQYLISHVGKYVPGKAMIVLIRYQLGEQRGQSLGGVIVATFYETFATLSAGAFVSTILFLFVPLAISDSNLSVRYHAFAGLAFLVHLGLLLPILPPIFGFACKYLAKPFGKSLILDSSFNDVRFLIEALAKSTLCWVFCGFSYFACLQAVSPEPLGINCLLPATAAVGLAFPIGFLSMVPGHAGVREYALIEPLQPILHSPIIATAAALLFRVVSLAVEVVVAAVLFWGRGR